MGVLRRVLVSFVWCLCVPALLQAQTLVWDPNPETDIAGYRVSYGTQSGVYTTEIDVGKQTYYQPPKGFDWSRTLYFAVRAYNTAGLISPFSNEAKWTPTEATTKVTSLQASAAYPLLTGKTVTWTATATNPVKAVEYQFWLYRKAKWTLARAYGSSNTFTWTPVPGDEGGPYAVQVWARAVGVTVDYESWLGTENFTVATGPMEVRADVDFPTPAGNQVTWTARFNVATSSTMEYRFLVSDQTGTWTVFRNYAQSNSAQWTPAAEGIYTVQAEARRAGSTAVEYVASSGYFDVARSPLSVSSLVADTSSPAATGTRITWTARVRGGMSGPIQYQFWLHSARTGWQLAQPYGSTSTFAWTPTWSDNGDHTVQVWVRSNGSTASSEASRSSTPIRIDGAAMRLTTTALFPVAPGSYVDWRADVADPTANAEYQFWVYSAATGSWTLGRAYGTDPTFRWIPAATGSYSIQAWARERGSTVDYAVYRGTEPLQVTRGPAQVVSLTSNVTFPASPGTTITWTAAATGGTAGPLQYQFWRWSNGTWILARDYSAVNTYSWTPTSKDVGDHSLQVWVRSAGSSVAYESFKGTGTFSIR